MLAPHSGEPTYERLTGLKHFKSISPQIMARLIFELSKGYSVPGWCERSCSS